MRLGLAVACTALLLPMFATGQKLELKLDSLGAKASEKAEVDLDGSVLEAARNMVPEDALKAVPQVGKLKLKGNAKDLLAAIKGIYVRNYEFAKPGEYSDKDLEPVRKQVGSGSGWSRIVNVKDKDDNVEIYLLNQGDQVRGFLILACEPKEVAVVHVIGTLSAEVVKELVSSNIRYDIGQ